MNKAQQKFLQRFLTYLTVEKSSSLLTVNNYERDINSFSEFLVTRFGESFQWKQVGALDIRAYLAELNKQDYARRTIARRISALRSLALSGIKCVFITESKCISAQCKILIKFILPKYIYSDNNILDTTYLLIFIVKLYCYIL